MSGSVDVTLTCRALAPSVRRVRSALGAALLAMVAGVKTPVAAQVRQSPAEVPSLIMEQAQRAVGADSLNLVAARWRARVVQDSSDRLARLGLGIAAMLSADSAGADHEFQRLLTWGPVRDPAAVRIAPYARLGQALLLYSIGHWAEAGSALSDAAIAMRAANDSAGEAQSLIFLVWIETRAHQPTADAHLARADSLIQSRDNALRGAWDCAHAAVLSAHHLPGSVEVADSGAALVRRAGDLRAAAQCEFGAAGDLAAQGRIMDALPRLGQVIALSAQSRDHMTHAAALQWRGFAELNMGYYGPAESDLLAAVAEASAHNFLAGVGWSELNLAAIAEMLGDAAGARRHGLRAYAALAAIKDSAGIGILQRSDARRALAVGDTAAARASALAAIKTSARHGIAADVASAHDMLAAVDVREGQWDSAAKEVERQQPLLAAGGAQAWARMLPWSRGRISLYRGDARKALRQFKQAELVLDSTQHVYRMALHSDMAVAMLHLGDTARALGTLQQAEGELDAWRSTLDDAGLRVLAFSASEPLAEPASDIAEVIAAAARSHRTAVGFALAERRRARELTDQLLRMQAFRNERPDSTGRTPHGPRTTDSPTVALEELQRALPDDSTAVLEYVTGTGTAPTTLFVATRHRAWGWLAPPIDSLVETIDRLDALVDHGSNAVAAERMLGTALLGQITTMPPMIHRLVIVPDGPLHRVPFSALRLADGTSVIERYAVSLAPSATVIVTEWQRPSIARPPAILAFGDPILPSEVRASVDGSVVADRGGAPVDSSADTTRQAVNTRDTTMSVDRDAPSAVAATGALPRLPWTADEATLVGAFSDAATVRLRGDASASFLERTPLGAFSIVHFATHAVVDDDVPVRSALALAPGGGQSGYVGPGDLAALRLTADLVVLSACRTARGAVVTGEGVRGLTGPLLAAGAHSVLATQWRLNDRDAVPLVYTLYLGMARGLPITEAVRRAALGARQAGRPEREWATFMLVGDPLIRILIHAPPRQRVPSWVHQYGYGDLKYGDLAPR
jgi:CHAT domain-containing protein/tetratricopeptide (TPR) repeat protein